MSGGGFMRRRPVQVALVVVSVLLILIAFVLTQSQGEEFFLSYTEDEYKTSLVSGNLTAAVTSDWPRVFFHHTEDRFSPIFGVSMPKLYLFNDSNGDGMFVRSEATHIAYLDRHHDVSWSISGVFLGTEPSVGEYAILNRSADIALYDDEESLEPVVDRWVRAQFSFTIFKEQTTWYNELGGYAVQGTVDMRIHMTIEVLRCVNSSGIVIEQLLNGGDEFLLTEDLGFDQLNQTLVRSDKDEAALGDDFAHRLNLTSLPAQSVDFAKDDDTVQAHYVMSSVPILDNGTGQTRPPMNCSYFSTGSGMTLHTAYMVPGANGTIVHEMCVGIDEGGFYTGVTDWFAENISAILTVSGAVVVVAALVAFIVMLRRKEDVDAAKVARDDDAQDPDRKQQGG